MTNWLELCRDAVAGVERVLAELPTRAEREPVVGAGRGGDDTTAVDRAAEQAILARFRDLDVTIVSEEVGRIGSGRTFVVVDPIDGSNNAKRGIPFFSLSIAIADKHGHGDRFLPLDASGPPGERLEPVPVAFSMDDVRFGFVHDFGTGEEWTARRGEGAWLNGEPLGGVAPKDELEILSFEATTTASIARDVTRVEGLAHRLRVMGSLALSLCHLAAGRVDGVCSLKPARSVDIAAAQLLVRELGLAIELFEDPRPFGEAELDLEGRSRVAAAGSEAACRSLAAALRR